MLLGPIFSLELVTCARRARYYLLRTLYASLLLFTLWVTYESSQARRPYTGIHGVANIARDFFQAFGVLQLLAILLLGPAMVAGAIAQERERRTIEYLFTSQLSNSDIVLGKLGARLLNMAFVLIAGLPVLALAMLLGGIPPAAMLSLSLLTIETLAAVCALSIAVSAGRRRMRDAVISTYLLLAALLIAPMIGYQFRYAPSGGFWGSLAQLVAVACEPLAKLNPFYVLFDTNSSSPVGDPLVLRLAWVVACYGGFTVGCLGLAIAGLRRSYVRSQGQGATRRRLALPAWRPAVWKRAMPWKEMFIEPAMGRLGWFAKLAVALLVLSLLVPWALALAESWIRFRARDFVEFTVAVVCCVECFGLLAAAARSATAVSSEKERDCWVALLSTPLTASEILGGKLLGNLYAARWVALLVLLLWAGPVLIEPRFAPAIVVQLATWALMLLYVSWLGIAFSQWCRNSMRAMGATLGLAVFAGGLYLPVAAVVLEFAVRAVSRGMELIILAPCVPFLLAYPVLFWDQVNGRHLGGEKMAGAAYVWGMIGYALATGALWKLAENRFNDLAGRVEATESREPEEIDPGA